MQFYCRSPWYASWRLLRLQQKAGIGQGIGLAKAAEGVARNPGASGKITTTLIIGLAMIESLCIYALVVALIILFAKPFGF
ncbi:MAG: ATP synthase F0 subunit C [Nitrospirae bacterium]|nr:ATP synthase F0 subunit C [Nitrospirota bacterium]